MFGNRSGTASCCTSKAAFTTAETGRNPNARNRLYPKNELHPFPIHLFSLLLSGNPGQSKVSICDIQLLSLVIHDSTLKIMCFWINVVTIALTLPEKITV